MSQWTLFSNHGHVLLFLARDPDARLRDVAEAVGITERAVQKIVRDLQDGGALSVSKKGRRNRYRINLRKPLRHELEAHRTIGDLVKLMRPGPEQSAAEKAAPHPAGAPPAAPAVAPTAEPRPSAPEKPAAKPEPAPEPEPEPKPEPPARKKAVKKKKPDGDQQGSLF